MNIVAALRQTWARLAFGQQRAIHPLRELFPALGMGIYSKHRARNRRRAEKRRARRERIMQR
ncbi:MAG: hypothetical protein AB1651_16875 [Pseudomonadota bacterium]